MTRKIIAFLLIIIGIGFIAYPRVAEYYYDNKQDDLLAVWEEGFETVAEIPDVEIETETIFDDFSYEYETGGIIFAETTESEEETAVEKKEAASYISTNLEGIMYIDKISLKLPILRGATQKNLSYGLASVESLAEPGGFGNYAVAGHRNRTYGRNFNRLDEVIIGDKVIIETKDGKFTYVITEKFRVLPEETDVLLGSRREKTITLITCDPVGSPTHRLILKGKLVE